MTEEKNKAMHKRLHFGYHCNQDEDKKYRELIQFLFENNEENTTRTPYGLIKYLLDFAYHTLMDDRLIELRDELYDLKKTKKRTLKDAFKYAMLITRLEMKKELKPIQ